MRLVPCDHCARHVREAEASCPFCAHPRAVASPRRATAAAALAASALLTVACGGSAAPSGESPTNGAPRSEESVGDESEAEAETETERSDTNEPPPRGPDGPGVVAAYGGPSPEAPRPPPPDDER